MDPFATQAAMLKAIAHPVRLRIVEILRRAPECVCHLSAALERPQPYISQQLAILRSAGVIVDERDGANVFYRLADPSVVRLVDAACEPMIAEDGGACPGRRRVAGCNCPKCSGNALQRC